MATCLAVPKVEPSLFPECTVTPKEINTSTNRELVLNHFILGQFAF